MIHGEELIGSWFGKLLFLISLVSLYMPDEMAGRMFGRAFEC